MTPALSLLGAFLMGIIFGLLFFYALWLTTQKIVNSAQPACWFISSWLIRMPVVFFGFYWVANGNWQLLIACLLGFIVGRWIISRAINYYQKDLQQIKKLAVGAKHES